MGQNWVASATAFLGERFALSGNPCASIARLGTAVDFGLPVACPGTYFICLFHGAVTTHGSVAVPLPLEAVVPEVRLMAGRTPNAMFTLLLLRLPFEYRLNSVA